MNELLDLIGNLQDCPWGKWRPATLNFCEAHRCGWIVAPAETWTNVGYFAVGIALLLFARRAPKDSHERGVRTRYGIYSIVVGIFSGLYHASHTYAFETLDLSSMLLLGTDMVVTNLRRLGWLRAAPLPFAALVLFGGIGLVLGTTGHARINVFGAYVVVAVGCEALLFTRRRRGLLASGRPGEAWAGYRPFIDSFVLFAVAYAAWIADYTKLVCNPDQHFLTGHGVWHLVNSACFLTLAKFYATGAGSTSARRAETLARP
jgi:hypothetical protein